MKTHMIKNGGAPTYWTKYKATYDPYYGDIWSEHIKYLKRKVKGLNGRLLCIDVY